MRVLIVRPYATVPDSNQYNLQHIGLAKAFLRKGHQCDIVYWVGRGEEKDETIKYENWEFTIFWRKGVVIEKSVLFNMRKIDELVSNYDVIQTEEYEQLFSCYLALKYPKKTIIYHGPYKSEYTKKYNFKSKIYDLLFLKLLLKKKTQFITKTNRAKLTMEEKGFKNVKISPVGLDLSKFITPNLDYKFYNYGSPLKMLYVGQICDRRCIMFLIDVVAALKEKGIYTILSVIGKGDADYTLRCQKHAKEKNVYENVMFLGARTQYELADEYSNNDLFIMATKYEIFGMVLLEAMYFGKLVIASKEGGTETIIENHKNGILIDSFEVEKWVDEIINIKENKYNNANMMKNAHDSIIQHFSWDESVEVFLKIYNDKLERN